MYDVMTGEEQLSPCVLPQLLLFILTDQLEDVTRSQPTLTQYAQSTV